MAQSGRESIRNTGQWNLGHAMQLSLSRVSAWRNVSGPSRHRQRQCLATSALCRITGNGATETVKIWTSVVSATILYVRMDSVSVRHEGYSGDLS